MIFSPEVLRAKFKTSTIMWLNCSMDYSEKGFYWKQRGLGENQLSQQHPFISLLSPPPACPPLNNRKASLKLHHVPPAPTLIHNL